MRNNAILKRNLQQVIEIVLDIADFSENLIGWFRTIV